jgi:hypothetical protein
MIPRDSDSAAAELGSSAPKQCEIHTAQQGQSMGRRIEKCFRDVAGMATWRPANLVLRRLRAAFACLRRLVL